MRNVRNTGGRKMKSYLDLVRIQSGYRRNENRMTRLCIFLAVFLVTVIFGMADMEIRTQKVQTILIGGGWHGVFGEITPEQMDLIASRPETDVAVRCAMLNSGLDQGYQIQGTETGIFGIEETFPELFPGFEITEGICPENHRQAVITEKLGERLGKKTGDTVTVTLPDGTAWDFTICGMVGEASMLGDQENMIFTTYSGCRSLGKAQGTAAEDSLFVSFFSRYNIQKTLEDIREKMDLKEEQVASNGRLLALMLQSDDPYVLQIYMVAAILALLVGLAGIFMIAGSLNSSTARRTEFFGMMRCLGATRKQVSRLVKREALGWCFRAVPAGIGLGCAVIWILCAVLRILSPGIFEGMPLFGISWIGIVCGGAGGFLTVLLAARSPAKKASQVTPQAAVSGNAGTVWQAKRAVRAGRTLRVETALGVHHALGSKKNFLLMVLSFSFSILLFLAFSAVVDFLGFAIVPLQPYAPDIMVESGSEGGLVSAEAARKLEQCPGGKRCFGRMIVQQEVTLDGKSRTVDLISYEEHQFAWAEEFLVNGTVEEARKGEAFLGVYYSGKPGSTVWLRDTDGNIQEIPVSGVISKSPDAEDGRLALVCSEEMFTRLTGIQDYTVVDIQLTRQAGDEQVRQLRSTVGEEYSFSDLRQKNRENRGAYYSAALFMYSFLVVIAMIAVFNIINSMAMSVSARTQQYGVMRAVGMSRKQIGRMIASEAWTYGIWGILTGCAVGIPLNRFAFTLLVTDRWGEPWELPVRELAIIVLVVAASVAVSAAGPVRKLAGMSIVKNVNTE